MVDVEEAEPLRNEPTDFLAARASCVRDADDSARHARDARSLRRRRQAIGPAMRTPPRSRQRGTWRGPKGRRGPADQPTGTSARLRDECSVHMSWIAPAARPPESTASVPSRVLISSRRSPPPSARSRPVRRGPHRHAARVTADVDRIVAIGAVDDDAVGLAAAGGTTAATPAAVAAAGSTVRRMSERFAFGSS